MMKQLFSKVLSVLLIFMAFPTFAQDVSYTLTPQITPSSMSEVMLGAKVTLDFGNVAVSLADDAAVTATPQKLVDDGYTQEYEPDGDPVSLPLHLDNSGKVYFYFDLRATAGTYYELKLARGTVVSEDGSLANMVKTWKYIVADVAFTLNPTVSPASMSEVMQGAKVTLNFGEENVTLADDAVVTATPYTEEEDGYDTVTKYGDPVSLPLSLDADGNVCFNFDVRGTAGTLYELKLARGTVINEEGTKANMVKTWKYILDCEPETMVVKTINPGKEEVETLSSLITINFTSQPQSIAEDATAQLTNEETGKTYSGQLSIPEYQEKVVKVKFDYGEDANDLGELCVPGTYTMTIAAGAITNTAGLLNAEISNTWKVSGTIDINDIEYTAAQPAVDAILTSLSSIEISFPASPVLMKKPGSVITIDDKNYDFSCENNTVIVRISPEITAEGNYTVILPAGSVYSLETGHGNKEVTLNYVVKDNSSVEALFMDGAESVTIYNCQGMCVKSDANADDIRNLQPGIYIVNGKKILKR